MKSASELPDCPSSDTTHQSWKIGADFAAPILNQLKSEIPWTRSALKVPRSDFSLFAIPDLESAFEFARLNAELLNRQELTLQGRPLKEFREAARREILDLAQSYTAGILGKPVPKTSAEELLFCSGHQPALFHPGVWVKNFSIHALAERADGIGLNLVVDNDTVNSRQLRVPIGDREHPATRRIDFDNPQAACPWEEAVIENQELFESFGDRVTEAMSRWQITPLISEMWPDAAAQSRRSSSLRDALTAARMHQERRWGLANLELPLSRVCETHAFCWFASAILTRLPRFWETYNFVLAEFRQINRIRSHTHPVPELTEQDGWYEAPFWVWSQGGQLRKRVIAKACSKEVRLSDGKNIFARLPIPVDGNLTAAAEILRRLPDQGIRFRTRALTTTLFARLCVADLFVHGIGGAKYDEMTDRIIARFFGLPAPGFLTMSCTVHLPLGEPFPVSIQEERALRHQLRDVQWNPERHLPEEIDPSLEELVAEKRSLIAERAAANSSSETSLSERHRISRENHRRHLRIKEINERLSGETAGPRQLLEAELASVREQLQANDLLQDREFSFSLYPEETLRPFLTGLLS